MMCLNKNKHNQVTTTYYLLHKKFEKEGTLKSGFKVESTPQKADQKQTVTEDDSPSVSPVKRRKSPQVQDRESRDESGIMEDF